MSGCSCTRLSSSALAVLTGPDPNPPVTHGQDDAPVPTKEAPLADIQDDPVTAASSPSPSRTFPVLVRASNGKAGEDREAGKRVKLSTVVDSDALDAFYVRYAEICKAGMGALKPRDRSKRKTKGKKKKTAAGGGA